MARPSRALSPVTLAAVPGLASASAVELTRVHECIRGFPKTVHRFEGTARVDVDEKGLLLLAVFGLPPRFHEDDAQMRGVLAASALQTVFAQTRLERGIGIRHHDRTRAVRRLQKQIGAATTWFAAT